MISFMIKNEISHWKNIKKLNFMIKNEISHWRNFKSKKKRKKKITIWRQNVFFFQTTDQRGMNGFVFYRSFYFYPV